MRMKNPAQLALWNRSAACKSTFASRFTPFSCMVTPTLRSCNPGAGLCRARGRRASNQNVSVWKGSALWDIGIQTKL